MSMKEFKPQMLEASFHNFTRRIGNLLADLPGERPEWIILSVSGKYPIRRSKRKLWERSSGRAKDVDQESFERTLEKLSDAHWLTGVILRFTDLQLSLSSAYLLRQQLSKFKQSGKGLIVYADQLSLPAYYLATEADRIVMPESGELSVFGFALEASFMKDALARCGVLFDKLAIKEYKNAGDQFARSSMSKAQREQYTALLEEFEFLVYDAITKARGLEVTALKAWVDEGITVNLAKDKGLIDDILYEDELLKELADKSKTFKPYKSVARFLKKRLTARQAGRIAVISLEGMIITGKSRRSPLDLPLLGGKFAGSETLKAAFRAAEADPYTKAIVFFVDSGGGSALASDLIWREVKRIKKLKPVVAVIGSVAASGGYYVLTHANHIIATPLSVTGSIGVVTAKFVLEDFYKMYGITIETIQRGRFAKLYSSAKSFDAEERHHVEGYMQDVYDRFLLRVSEGRSLKKEQVDTIARGRIWTGKAAYEKGLIDEFGGVSLAVERAKDLANLKEASIYDLSTSDRYRVPSTDLNDLVAPVLQLMNEQALLMQEHRVQVKT